MPADDGVDLAAFHLIKQRLETGPHLAGVGGDVVVDVDADHVPTQAIGQLAAVVLLALDAQAVAAAPGVSSAVVPGSLLMRA